MRERGGDKAKTKKMGERLITQLDIAFDKKAEGLQSGGKGILPETVQLDDTSRRE